jgi:phosphonoacetaldehyde hydrolase
MCYLNAVKLQTYPLEAMVKIGDTINDIQEGLNAGMWTIGVTQSGNELGMTRQQVEQLEPPDLRRRLADIEQRFKTAGAHYVADGIWQCVPIVDEINQRLARGERPLPAG